jgi:hypothetical protein
MVLLVALFGLVVIVSLAFEFSVLAGLVVTFAIVAVWGFLGLAWYFDRHDQ